MAIIGFFVAGGLRKPRLLARIACLVCVMLPGVAQTAKAQRGGRFEVYRPSADQPSATKGFQGFFDTEQLSKGTFTAELFTFSLDYGVTDRWSLGTNGLAVLGLPLGLNTLIVKSRYRFLESEQLISSLTAYAGGIVFPASSTGGFAYLGMLTSNTTYALSENHALGASFGVLRVGLEQADPGDLDYGSIKGTLGYGGVLYHWSVSPGFGLEALFVPLVVSSLEIDAASAAISIDSLTASSDGLVLFGRLSADFRFGSSFLLSPMMLVFANTGDNSGGGVGAVPWINMIFRFGGD